MGSRFTEGKAEVQWGAGPWGQWWSGVLRSPATLLRASLLTPRPSGPRFPAPVPCPR